MARIKQKKESDIDKDGIDKNFKKEMDIRDIVENSLIKDYPRYIDHLERNEWRRESIKIHEHLTTLVTISSLSAGREEVVIDIICPPGNIISIMGKNSPYSVRSVHSFELKLANSNGTEIDQNTNIKIFKDKIFKKRIDICDILYKDVSMLDYFNTPNMFKGHNELYRFDQGIELKGEDHLRIYVIDPDIDINTIKFNLSADLWVQYDNIMI